MSFMPFFRRPLFSGMRKLGFSIVKQKADDATAGNAFRSCPYTLLKTQTESN